MSAHAATVLEVVKLYTRYDDKDLLRDVPMEEVLGIDSIMLASIVQDLNKAYKPATPLSPIGLDTLNDLIARFEQLLPVLLDAPAQLPCIAETEQAAVSLDVASSDELTMRDFLADGDPNLFGKVARFESFYQQKVADRQYWYGMPSLSPCENRVSLFDQSENCQREFLMFASNSYLGLNNHPKVVDAICQAAKKYGATNTGCRLIGGTNTLHLQLEERLAALKGREACIVFPSGYSANLGTIAALTGPKDTVITDSFNHMSIQDGCKLSGARKRIYQHNSMSSLEDALQRSKQDGGGILIVADGVFSMHGDLVPLPELMRLARHYGAKVLIDDAHSTGVLGVTGAGTAEHFGMKGEVDLELGTLSKALSGMGGFVAGDKAVIDYLRFYANSYVFAATIPAHIAAGVLAALDVMAEEPERLTQLWSNVQFMKSVLMECGFNTGQSDSAIIPIEIGSESLALAMGAAVRAQGLFCQTVVFPGVAVGDARLRLSILASHTRQDLEQAASILLKAARDVQLPGVR